MSNLIIDLCQKVIKGGIDTCKTWGEGECTGIRCEQDHCPFAYGLLCNLGNENKRVEIANKYLFENGIEVEEDNKMQEKTFQEVIATIKEREIWVCEKFNRKIIKADDGIIEIRKINNETFDHISALLFSDEKYKLQRKEFTFEEAFKAYEDGIKVESVFSGISYEKANSVSLDIVGEYSVTLENEKELMFSIGEIRGKWYINN